MPHPENDKAMLLSCPTCALTLKGGLKPDTLECESKHTWTITSLLLGQSIQAGLHLNAGLALLDQQVKLVRAIALEQAITKPDAFLQLEMKADILDEVILGIKDAIRKSNE